MERKLLPKELKMILHFSKKALNKRAVRRYSLMLIIKVVINAFSIQACAQTIATPGWPVLEAGLSQKSATQRLAAVRVLGLIPDDPHCSRARYSPRRLSDSNPLTHLPSNVTSLVILRSPLRNSKSRFKSPAKWSSALLHPPLAVLRNDDAQQ